MVTQSEICRETLKAEIQNLLLYGDSIRKRVDKVRSLGPWIFLGLPVAGQLLGLFLHKKKQNNAPPSTNKIKGGIATALTALQLYRKYGPLVRNLVSRFASRRRSAAQRTPAADF